MLLCLRFVKLSDSFHILTRSIFRNLADQRKRVIRKSYSNGMTAVAGLKNMVKCLDSLSAQPIVCPQVAAIVLAEDNNYPRLLKQNLLLEK